MTDENAEKKSFVVKLLGRPEVTEQGLFAEVFGNLVAREFGVFTPMPALINVSAEFLSVLLPVIDEAGSAAPYSPGIAVGCEFYKGLLPVTPGSFSVDQQAEASMIYAVDMLLQNPDRRNGKPNCAISDGKILAFDYELSWSFMMALFGCREPWNAQEVPNLSKEHIFRSVLKQIGYSDWSTLKDKLDIIGDGRLDTLIEALPEKWVEKGKTAKQHIEAIAQRKDDFITSLQRTLQ